MHVEVGLLSAVNDRRMRALWTRRRGRRATPLLLVAPAAGGAVRVLGPERGDDPMREIGLDKLLRTLAELEGKSRRDAVAGLTAALERLDRSGIPGIVIRGLLTKHLLIRRLPRDHPKEWKTLQEVAARVRRDATWRENFAALGYVVEERSDRGYLLRAGPDRRPVAVVHPLPDAAAFSKMTAEGSPPEGVLVADCRSEGVQWGMLATDTRFRLFPAETAIGAATARYLEMDLVTTEPDDWVYVGLLAPESLEPDGLLERLVQEAIDLGNSLRAEVEQQISELVLPSIARGLGEHERRGGVDLASPNTRKLIEDAALLVLFRVLFFLYLESRGYLPLGSAAYRPHSATELVREARAQGGNFDDRATTYWDRFVTLVNVMRTGRAAWGIPAYNGDLFAADVLEGAELLDETHITDASFGGALAALSFDPEGEAAEAGVDYGDLEVAHLGRIYEGLLSLRLSFATESLYYDARIDRYVPAGRRTPEIAAGELFFQAESGGRKAGGVYYTPQPLVRHLVDHAVLPALEEHLGRVAVVADRNAREAAALLFDFKVLDPAMGSAHFLADALDRVSERISTFLAERPLKPVIQLLDDLRSEAKWEGRIEDHELLRRLVLKRCIYGVDLSRMAVEVGKVTLWLASFVPGLSLAYLGHNLRQGDALVGVADTAVLEDLGPLFAEYEGSPIPMALESARQAALRVSEGPDRTPEEVEASRRAEADMEAVTAGLARVFDVWSSEPFGHPGARSWLIGNADRLIQEDGTAMKSAVMEAADQEAQDRYFFHWPLAFPEVFMRERDPGLPETRMRQRLLPETRDEQLEMSDVPGRRRAGFDVVIGNPPWEELTIEELAFYALHDPGLRGFSSEADRRARIHRLDKRYPGLRDQFKRRQEDLEGKRRFFGPQGGYVAQGTGDVDTYKLFCERYRSLARQGGWLGVVLPRSALLVDGARGFRRWLFGQTEVRRLDFILNAGRWAFDMEPRYTLVLLSAHRTPPSEASTIGVTGPSSSLVRFEEASAYVGIPVPYGHLQRWTSSDGGPGYEVPLLPSPEAVGVLDKIRRGPRFALGYPGVWTAFPVRELDETNDRRLFRHGDGIPVWKGRSFDQFHPHGAEPAGYAREKEVMEKLQSKRKSGRSAFKGRFPAGVLADPRTHPFYSARVAFRDVSRATDSRTVRACLVPPQTFLTNSAPYLAFPLGGALEQAFVLGVLNSLAFDWQARRFVETHMNFFILNILCDPPPGETDLQAIAVTRRQAVLPGRAVRGVREGLPRWLRSAEARRGSRSPGRVGRPGRPRLWVVSR